MYALLISLLEAAPEKITYPYQYTTTGQVDELNALINSVDDACTFEEFTVVDGTLMKTVTFTITSNETLHTILNTERDQLLTEFPKVDKKSFMNRFIRKPDTSNDHAAARINARYREYLLKYPVTPAHTTSEADTYTEPISHTVNPISTVN